MKTRQKIYVYDDDNDDGGVTWFASVASRERRRIDGSNWRPTTKTTHGTRPPNY